MSTTGRSRVNGLADCPCSGKSLDRLLQPAVLAVLARGPAHGYRILQELAQMPPFGGRAPDAAGVYRYLKALQTRGLVTASLDASGQGPARRLFELSAAGRQCLSKWIGTLKEYHRQVGAVLACIRKTLPPGKGCCCGGQAKNKAGARPARRKSGAAVSPRAQQ